MSKEKGVDVFCNAINELKLKAIVVGDGEERNNLEKKYKDSNIKFVGWQDINSVYSYMKKAKVLIFPSVCCETMGLTILEAKSLGLPSIVSKLTAGSEFIDDKNDGFLYDGTLSDLVNKILLYEESDIKKISKKAYFNYWQSSYNEVTYYKNLMAYYYEVMK